jgi:large subunit ribosomal protein L4
MNKKEKRAALKSALTSRVQENRLVVVDELKFDAPKTKDMVKVLGSLNADNALVVLNENDKNVVLSGRNIDGVKMALTNTINVFDILNHKTLVLTKDAVKTIEEVYA